MTGREALILIIAEGLIAAIAICIAWHYAAEAERLKGEHAARARVRAAEARFVALLRKAPPLQEHRGHHGPQPGPALPNLDHIAPQVAVAEAMPQPRGRHARRLPLTEQVIPVPRIGTQPWETAPFAAAPDRPAPSDPGDGLTEVDLVRPYTPPTDEETRDLYFPPASSFPCCRHCTPPCETHHVACMDCQPAFGADRCEADVLADEAGARLSGLMLP